MNGLTTCTTCGGLGKRDVMRWVPCFYCAGTGINPSSILWSELCLKCNGAKGRHETVIETCQNCGGSGQVP